MSAWKPIVSLAKRALLLLTLTIVMALVTLVGLNYYQDSVRDQVTELQQAEKTAATKLAQKEGELLALQRDIGRFTTLRQQGMVGEADRAAWTEQFLASHKASGLPDRLTYTLQAPKPIALQAGAAVAPEATGASTVTAMFHDFDFSLSNVHEAELLQLIQSYQKLVKGRFRVDKCGFDTRTEAGLTATCTLRFFTLPDAAATTPTTTTPVKP